MAITLRIPGQTETAITTATRGGSLGAETAPVTNLLDDVEVVHAFSLSPTARAAGAVAPRDVVVEDDDILEIEVDGFTQWTSVKQYEESLRTFRPEAVQDGAIVVDALPRPAAAERGFGELRASAVRVLRLGKDRLADQLTDPAIVVEFANDFGLDLVAQAGSWATAKALTWLIERQLRPREGLYTWANATRTPLAQETDPSPASFDGFDIRQPILLFLHGTGSSTRGSFGEFLGQGAKDQWNELARFFNQHVYAFEHKTLSRSPVENALAVADRLPAGASLYLVSHSRGGMIGDLLCLPAIDADQIAAFTRHGEFDDADQYDRQSLQRLARLLAEKRFRVQRFARAACPARGTVLASENLDQFLSVLTYLVGLIPFLKATPLYEVVKRITLETVHRRWEPGMLPGLEAMTPSSPLVRLLNTAKGEAAGALGVIAGDIQGGNWLKRFGVFISDRFIYENRDNDLIVNTSSMFQGASHKAARYVFDRGSDVSHFNYFKNARTRMRVSEWLTAKNELALPEFRDLAEARVAPVALQRSAGARASTTRPLVFMVPDVMGSDLYAGTERIWLNHDALVHGGFGRLADVTSPIETRSVLGEHYQLLHDYLAGTHDVIPFAYDWRLSIVTAATRLGAKVDAVLAETTQPVRIVAHGMGGLVVRHMMNAQPKRWERLCARDGGRVVFLGTPHGGTYESVELLLGSHPVAQQLALLDQTLGTRGVVEIFQTFPGILELLPADKAPGFFAADTWQAFAGLRGGAKPPDPTLLAGAGAVRDALGPHVPHLERVCNVAGSAPATVCGVAPRERQIALDVTTEGDGRVTHDAVRLSGVATWYMDAAHGRLAAHAQGFPALLDLLQQGETKQLPTTLPSVSRGGVAQRRTVPERVLYPTEADLLAGVFGLAPPSSYRSPEAAGFRVAVVHGDLSFARFPIVVGHYEGDTIIGAESVVDHLLERALTTRYNLGLYPGPLGTVSVVLRQPSALQRALQLPNGAVIIGLGRWGELTAGQVANLVRRGALHYVLQLDDDSSAGEATGAATGSSGVGLSVLLIGSTSASNISIDDSVAAILRGIAQANRELDERVDRATTRVAEVEIMELYVDTAIEAARAAKRLSLALSDELKIRIDAAPRLQRGRHGRVRLAASQSVDAWRRWEITAMKAEARGPQLPEGLRRWLEEAVRKGTADPALLASLAGMAVANPAAAPHDRLRFVSLSDRARAEVMMDQHQPDLIDRLIRSSINDTQFHPESARALFELMVPNDLKDGLGQLSRVVFVVDGYTSTYPWELMTDGGDRPLCTRIGMVRQLQTAQFRPHIRATTARTAFVVGDPLVGAPFQQLPGARREAEVVAARLSGKFDVTFPQDRPAAITVLGGLFAQPYRIVHLAGHGHYEPPDMAHPLGRSGMVLDRGVFLTAAELRKMSQVPELVFLNCCFIGQTGPEAPPSSPDVEFNRLAASVARELIEMGVRAVVAAGWAVRDDAALTFALTFYDAMLARATFGRALQSARERTWNQFGDSNTWGAYQAYGDPEFRLETEGARAADQDDKVAPEELLDEIGRIRRNAQNLGREQNVAEGTPADVKRETGRQKDEIGRLDRMVEKIPEEWLKRSDVRMAIGEAYGELTRFGNAVEHLEAALDTGELDSKTTMKAAEQFLNFAVRDAAKQGDLRKVRGAIARLQAMQQVGPTSERFSLLGGAFKRLANVLKNAKDTRSTIRRAADSYRKAHEHDVKTGTLKHYPVVNWLALTAVLGTPPAEAESLLTAAEANARESFVQNRDPMDAVFDAVAPADIAVVRALLRGTFGKDTSARRDEIARIVGLYAEAFHRAQATRRQRDSATGQLESLAGFVKKLAGTAATRKSRLTQAALTEIQGKFRGID
jgi:hypothetical protein